MRVIGLFSFGLLSVMVLSGCMQTATKDWNTMKIGELDKGLLDFDYVNTDAPTPKGALENYRAYLSDNENTLHFSEALKRLAALELEVSEAVDGQVTEKQTKESEQALMRSIEHYKAYLKQYPDKKDNDFMFYQLAKAYDFIGDTEKSLSTLTEITRRYPDSEYIDEVQFRRGEILFVFTDYINAEKAYSSVANKTASESKFVEKARYKLAWSQFKRAKYIDSLESCLVLLDTQHAQGKLGGYSISANLTRSEMDFINDVLRLTNLSLTYKDDAKTIQQIFTGRENRQYEPLVYQQLGEFYLKNERTVDAVKVFLNYGKYHPNTLRAAEFHMQAIDTYKASGLMDLLLATKVDFVKNFGVGSVFWQSYKKKDKKRVTTALKVNIKDLAKYYHAIALKSGKPEDYTNTSFWYETYLSSFPKDPEAPLMNFLLAESQHDAKKYRSALNEYVKTAYDYKMHSKSAEAGYAAILTYNLLIDKASDETRAELEAKALKNSIRFSFRFKNTKYAPAVIAKSAEKLYENKDYKGVIEFSSKNEQLQGLDDKSHYKATWLVYAHSLFEKKEFPRAEEAYKSIRKLMSENEPHYDEISDKMAASIYMQAVIYRDMEYFKLASYHFLRVGKLVPTSSIAETAQYDAAAMQVKLKNWSEVINVLEEYREKFPDSNKYKQEISEKLLLSYIRTGHSEMAADEANNLSKTSVEAEEKRAYTWQAAELYQKSGLFDKANKIYVSYINKYPSPFAQGIEGHQRVIDYYRKEQDAKSLNSWLQKTVKAEKRGDNNRTERTRFIAATAAMELASPLVSEFKQIELTVPLKKSLKIKKRLMKKALDAYTDLMTYKIADITTESTYYVADIYGHFAESLMKSQRPGGLNEEELEQYDILLEEQAYPFEEKAIEIHGANAKRTSEGLYDEWVKKSIAALSVLQPIRYAKSERIDQCCE